MMFVKLEAVAWHYQGAVYIDPYSVEAVLDIDSSSARSCRVVLDVQIASIIVKGSAEDVATKIEMAKGAE